MTPQNPGGLLDMRPQELKAKDYKDINPELASAVTLNWVEKEPTQWKNYPARDQDGSSSCVAQSMAKALYVLNKDIYSAHPIYRSRMNFSGVGMYLYDAGDIAKKQGTVLETQDPSQQIGEAQMNQAISAQVQDILKKNPTKIGSYVYVTNYKNIDDIASKIEQFGHCMITVGSNYNEWSSIPQVQGMVDWYHCICAIDYVLYKGKKYLVIEDSWGSNIGQFDDRRLLSQEFISARCTGAMYLTPPVVEPPFHYTFTKTLQMGDKGIDVEALQKALKRFGFFPAITPTQYFGPVTKAAVDKFQLAYKEEILFPAGLSKPTGIFGANSIKKMNSLLLQ